MQIWEGEVSYWKKSATSVRKESPRWRLTWWPSSGLSFQTRPSSPIPIHGSRCSNLPSDGPNSVNVELCSALSRSSLSSVLCLPLARRGIHRQQGRILYTLAALAELRGVWFPTAIVEAELQLSRAPSGRVVVQFGVLSRAGGFVIFWGKSTCIDQ